MTSSFLVNVEVSVWEKERERRGWNMQGGVDLCSGGVQEVEVCWSVVHSARVGVHHICGQAHV